jgi:two-component system, NarL family, nitrate/nitrite response regulator NarL
MRGLPASAVPARVLVWGDLSLVAALQVRGQSLEAQPAEGGLEVAARLHRPDVIVLDGREDGLGLLQLKGLAAPVPVLALVPRGGALEAIAAGASGALSRDASPEAIAAAVHALREGLAVFDRGFLGEVTPAAPTEAQKDQLTAREREVLGHLAEGLSNKQIAVALEISEHTAKFHVNSILQKLGAQKRVEAVVRAARLGIIDL